MITFLLGPSHCGKTHAIWQQISRRMEEQGEKKDILLVPEQATLLTERELIGHLGNRASSVVEVLSFKRLCSRVFGEYGGAAGVYADKVTASLLMAAALNQEEERLTVFGGCGKRQEVLEEMVQLMTELKNYGVTPEQLTQYALENQEGILRMKTMDAALIYESYQQKLEQSFKDPRDDLTRVVDKLEQTPFLQGRQIYLDGFTGFTPQELRVVEQMMRFGAQLTITLCMERQDRGDTFYMTRKTLGQLERIAQGYGLETQRVWLEECHGVKPSLQFLQREIFTQSTAQWPDGGDVVIAPCQNSFQQLEVAAHEIERLHREKGWPYHEFLLLARDITQYSETIDAVFHRHGIPVFLSRPSGILLKPVMMVVLGALDILRYSFTYEGMFRYIKTGLAGLSDSEGDLLENYVLKWNIRGGRWQQPFTSPTAQPSERLSEEEEEKRIAQMEQLRQRCMGPLLQLKEEMGRNTTVRQRCVALYHFITAIQLPETIQQKAKAFQEEGLLELAGQYNMLWDILMTVLDRMVDVMGEEKISLEDFAEILKGALSSYDINLIPTSLDEVSAAGADRVRSRQVKCVMILGMNEGEFPKGQADDGIFSDREKEQLAADGIQLSPTARERMFMEQYYIYSALAYGGEQVYLFYETGDMAGNSKFPSYIIERTKQLMPKATVLQGKDYFIRQPILLPKKALDFAALYGKQPDCRAKAEGYLSQLKEWPSYASMAKAVEKGAGSNRPWLQDRELIRGAFGKVLEGSASRIERYNSCKFSYFMEYGLHAQPRAKSKLSAMEMGTFVHFVLERFFLLVEEEQRPLDGLDKDTVRDLVERCVEQFLKEQKNTIREQSARGNYLFRRLVRVTTQVVLRLLDELKRSKFRPMRFELGLGLGKDSVRPLEYTTPFGTVIRVVGKVDRMDGYQKDDKLYVKIVDYKTGSKELDFSDIYHGLSIQMLIYLFAIWENGKEVFHKDILPAGALYFRAHDPLVEAKATDSDETIEKARQKKYKMSGIVLEDEEIVDAMEEGEGGRVYLPVSVSDGAWKGNTATIEKFQKLKGYLAQTITQMAQELEQGDISIDPYLKKGVQKGSPCTYCKYAAACRMEKDKQENYRAIYKMKANEFWDKMEKEGESRG